MKTRRQLLRGEAHLQCPFCLQPMTAQDLNFLLFTCTCGCVIWDNNNRKYFHAIYRAEDE